MGAGTVTGIVSQPLNDVGLCSHRTGDDSPFTFFCRDRTFSGDDEVLSIMKINVIVMTVNDGFRQGEVLEGSTHLFHH